MYATPSCDEAMYPVKYGALTKATFGAMISLRPRMRL